MESKSKSEYYYDAIFNNLIISYKILNEILEDEQGLKNKKQELNEKDEFEKE